MIGAYAQTVHDAPPWKKILLYGTQCLDWLLVLGPRQLDRVLCVYVDRYNTERPHRGARATPAARDQPPTPPSPQAAIERRDRLGGLLHEYHLAAARRNHVLAPFTVT